MLPLEGSKLLIIMDSPKYLSFRNVNKEIIFLMQNINYHSKQEQKGIMAAKHTDKNQTVSTVVYCSVYQH